MTVYMFNYIELFKLLPQANGVGMDLCKYWVAGWVDDSDVGMITIHG